MFIIILSLFAEPRGHRRTNGTGNGHLLPRKLCQHSHGRSDQRRIDAETGESFDRRKRNCRCLSTWKRLSTCRSSVAKKVWRTSQNCRSGHCRGTTLVGQKCWPYLSHLLNTFLLLITEICQHLQTQFYLRFLPKKCQSKSLSSLNLWWISSQSWNSLRVKFS